MKKYSLIVVLIMAVIASQIRMPLESEAKNNQKEIIIAKIKGNTMYYHKAVEYYDIIRNAKFGCTVGYGKKKSIKISKNIKYYLLAGYSYNKLRKVSLSKFKKEVLYHRYEKEKEGNVVYYSGMYCCMTMKDGKCIKLVQRFQS